MKKIKVVVFDCDGVMFDSKKANKEYYNSLLFQFGMPRMSEKQTNFAHSHTLDETLKYLVKKKSSKIIENYKRKINYAQFIKLMKIEPSLYFVLSKMRSSKKIAIATNRTDSIKQLLIYFNIVHLFDFIICSLDVKNPKPDSSMLNKVLEYFQVHPSKALYIGDSKLDEIASRFAQIPFISYKNKRLKAVAHIDSLLDLESIV